MADYHEADVRILGQDRIEELCEKAREEGRREALAEFAAARDVIEAIREMRARFVDGLGLHGSMRVITKRLARYDALRDKANKDTPA